MKLQKFLDEGPYKLVFAGFHLKDNILDEMTVEELQETVYSNIPNDKISIRTVQREFESLLKTKIADARFVAKKVIPELTKDLQSMVEDKNLQEKKWEMENKAKDYFQTYMKKVGGNQKKVRREIMTNVVDNPNHSNDFVEMMWSHFKKQFPS